MSARSAQVIAPIAAFALTYGARKVLEKAYQGRTGHVPPDPGDLRSPILPAIGWAVSMAVVSTVIESVITRRAAVVQAQAVGAAPADVEIDSAAGPALTHG